MADNRRQRGGDHRPAGKGRGQDGKSKGGFRGGHGKGDQRRGGQGRGPQSKGGQGGRPPANKKPRPHQGEFRSEDPNEPVIPAGVLADDLDDGALKALSTLSGSNREIVARHLVVAGQLIDVEPELAYQHATAAVKRAGRVDVVREAAALTAYASGRYEEALREVRAVRRMRGDHSLRAIEADCERGLGRPERAVEILEETDTGTLPLDEQVELVLVAAGARADMGQLDFSLMIVEQAMDALPEDADPYLVRRLGLLRAERLADLDRPQEASDLLATLPEEEDEMEIVDLGELLDGDVDDVRTDLRGSEEPLSVRFDGALLDLDGVCFHGARVYPTGPAALETAENNRMQLGFVTNNASRTPQEVADKLTDMGYVVEGNQVVTAATDLMYDLAEALPEGSRVLVVGTESLARVVAEAGYQVAPDAIERVDAVVQGFGPNVDWAMLTEAAYALSDGAKFFATNLDATLPTERGFALGNGALVAAVSRATGKRAVSGGKPRPEIFTRAAAKLRMERAIVVGDRLNTDIAGAVAAKLPSLHVLSGVNSARDVVLAQRGQRPSFLAIDIEGLNEPHPVARHHRDGTWTCGVSQTVKIVRGGAIEIAEIPIHEDGDEVTLSLDTYRALVAASWDYGDERRRARCPHLRVVDNDDDAGIVSSSNKTDPESEEVLSEESANEQ